MNIDKIKQIIYDELETRANFSKYGSSGHHELKCAIRIMLEVYQNYDFDATVELARYIKDSWTDLEYTEQQVDLIVLQSKIIITKHIKSNYEEPISAQGDNQ